MSDLGKGASYGAHENYLMDRRTPFVDIIRGLVPFFVTRQVRLCGGCVALLASGQATLAAAAAQVG